MHRTPPFCIHWGRPRRYRSLKTKHLTRSDAGTCEPNTLTSGHVYGGEIADFDTDFDLDFDWSFLLCPQWGMGRTE